VRGACLAALLLLAPAAAPASSLPATAFAEVCVRSQGLYAGRVKFVSERLGPGATFPDWAQIAAGQTICHRFETGQPLRIEAQYWLRMVWHDVCPAQHVRARQGLTLVLHGTVFEASCQ